MDPLEKNKMVLPAKPDPLKMDLERTALIVIDMQNDFGSKGGLFDRAGIDISAIQNVVGPIARVVATARNARVPVVYLKMGFRFDLSDAGQVDAPNQIKHRHLIGEKIQAPDGKDSRILIRDTWNTDIVDELKPLPGDTVVYKHRFSGFYETDLDRVLQRLNTKYLVITGCTTSVCVESTMRDAMFRDYTCVLLEDCTAEPIGRQYSRSNHEASLFVLQSLFGWVSDSSEFQAAIEASAPPLSAAL